LLIAVIGILMGRFLCKNGEHKEIEKRTKIIHAFKTSQNELKINQEKLQEQSIKIRELEDTIDKKEQKISNIKTNLVSSDKQRVKLLEELKVLEKYKIKFESLENEFRIQSTMIEKLKSEKIINQDKIDRFKILIEKLKTKDRAYQKLKNKLESVENKYVEFKIKYNLNNDKLKNLEKENKEIYNLLEDIEDEREDLIERLRAISSVVGAVGINNNTDSK
ncbi:MAG: hypothetical protein KAU90_11335, partial [Sulfurovaceae bacterium]|nr:hypothetical protein [Sulfurovaceae bacterium]